MPKARAISRVPTFPAALADEGDEVILGGKTRLGARGFHFRQGRDRVLAQMRRPPRLRQRCVIQSQRLDQP